MYEPTGEKTAEVSDGTLKITAHKITASSNSDWMDYISARLNTKESWAYGYMEMKAKLPVEQGCWPAFWMLPDPDYGDSYVRDESLTGGEIDIVEYVPGEDDSIVHFSAHSYNATGEAGANTGYVHPSTGVRYSYSDNTSIADPGTEWHYFSVLWTHEEIRGYLDGVEYYYAPNPTPEKYNVDNPDWGFDKPFYLKLNLAMGGSWGGEIAEDFTSASFEIDYVRVYKQ